MRRPIRAAVACAVESLEARQFLSSNVVTYHNDTASTGQDLAEMTLTPANVNVNDFGKLYSTPVDGQVYAQPLYVSGVNVTAGANQGTHNVVYVATEHDSLYAIDGDKGTVLWQDSFLVPEAALTLGGATVTVTTVPSVDVKSGNISPEIGITATPAIDPASGFLYLTAKTKQIVYGNTSAPHYVYTLYKVNIQDGTYTGTVIGDTIYTGGTYTFRTGSDPYVLDPGGAGAGVIMVSGQRRVYFNTLRQMNRPGITLNNGNVYLAFGSHGDNLPYHGWILGYDENTLANSAVLNLNPNGSYDGIWQGGGRIDVDPQGYMYVETGNGSFDTTLNAQGFPINGDYGDSFVKIGVDSASSATNQNTNGWGLKVVDYFTPLNQSALSSADEDLGSGGPMVLPDSVGSAAHPRLLVGAGKEGKIYLIDRDNMGKFHVGTDQVVQEVSALPGGGSGGSYGTPAFFSDGTTARIYYGGQNTAARTFTIANAALSTTPDSKSTDSYGAHGSTPSISANGAANGIVWDLEFNTGQLRAYNASSYAQELYTTAQAGGRDQLGGAVLFAVPTIANGQVFVGTSKSLVAYGEFAAPTSPPAAPTGLTATAVSNTQINLSWQDNAINEAGDYVEQSIDGGNTWNQIATTGVKSASYAVTGLQPGATYSFRVRAFNVLGNSAYSDTASATTPNLTPTLNFAGGFANAGGLLSLNGSVTSIIGSNLQLTDGKIDEAGSAFSDSTVSVDHFDTAFTFQLTSATADGFTFTIQRVGPTALGGVGGGLGYSGIPSSVAIKFDLYDNAGEGNDSTGLFINGDGPTVPSGAHPVEASVDMSSSSVDLHSGDVMQATLHYDGTTLQETITDTVTHASFTHSYAINIPSTIGGSTAYVGFTGATGGATAVQDILTWTYTPLPAPPATPTNLTVTPASGSELDLAWSETSSPVDYFTILRKGPSDATYTQLAQVPGAQTMYMNTALTQNTTYSYEVIAGNAGGVSAPAGPVTGATPIAPAAPSNLQATNITTTGVTLTWQDNANNAAGYKVTRQLASNESILVATLSPTETSYTDNTLLPGSPYQYVVAAFNLAGPSMGAEVPFQTLAAAPSALAATAGGQQVTLSWNASAGASGYNVYRGPAPGGESGTPIATNVTADTFTDTGLPAGQTYYYQVSAIDGGGEGPLAAEVSATPLLPGDADGDGKVDFADFTIVARHYGLASGASWSVGDFNNDGSVGFDDLVILARNYGRSIASTTAAVQPTISIVSADASLAARSAAQPAIDAATDSEPTRLRRHRRAVSTT